MLLAILALDTLAVAFSLYAALSYLRVLLRWDPASISMKQIRLEADCDAARLVARYAMGFFVASSLLLVLAITLLLPPLIPGAMCGTGVLQATGGFGTRGLALRALALAVLWVWQSLDGIHRTLPRRIDEGAIARWNLLSVPLLLLAALYTLRALLQLDPYQPVDCCQVVYDTFTTKSEATHSAGLSDAFWLVGSGGLGLAVAAIALAGLSALRRGRSAFAASTALFVATLVWLPFAGTALVTVLSAYHYQVLQHHCPWCLFLPVHGAVGYPLLASLLLITLESFTALSATFFSRKHSGLLDATRHRLHRAFLWVLGSWLVFVALSWGPALLWRLRYGVWMG